MFESGWATAFMLLLILSNASTYLFGFRKGFLNGFNICKKELITAMIQQKIIIVEPSGAIKPFKE